MLSRSWMTLIIIASFGLIISACEADDAEDETFDATPTVAVADDDSVADEPTPEPEPTPFEDPAPTPTPDMEPRPEATPTSGQAQAAIEIDPADLTLTRDEMGDGWRRDEILTDEESRAPEAQYCGWGEEVPGWAANAVTSFHSTDGSVMIQYVYLYPEGDAEHRLEAFAEQIASCDFWREDTEQGEVTTHIASFPMPNLGDDAVSFHMEMTHESGMELGEFVIVFTRYDDVILAMGTMQAQHLNLGYRGSEYLHEIDAKVREALDRPAPGIGDPLRTTHGLEITPLGIEGPEPESTESGRSVWRIQMEACSDRDGRRVNQYVKANFNGDLFESIDDDFGGDLDAGECMTGEVSFYTDTEEVELRTIRYDITPAIVVPYGWLQWDVREK